MIFLVDHNLERHALILSGSISNQGWLDWLSIRFVTLEEMALSIKSDDRIVWQFAQSNQMILLTANRRMKGKNSLEQVLREENIPTSLPVITLGDADRFLKDSDYREACVNRLIEIMLYIENYMGASRVFIP
ncbi:MAG: ACP S-malonyltransferase [Komarekiella atlantica HA4396-MV6]|jgi:predicted nuclease of predicted toxin-antitoxin system|nr:ACP S-malonyltransferase [Komarekiella atlantica HA4396-MV6]